MNWCVVFRNASTGEMEVFRVEAPSLLLAQERGAEQLATKFRAVEPAPPFTLWAVRRTEP